MNIHGLKKRIKILSGQEKFWGKCSENANMRGYKTAEGVCDNHAAGERAKIRWHKLEIKRLQGNKQQ